MREREPYLFKIGSKEAGQKWSEIASALNTHSDFAKMPREQRSVRERFNKIIGEFKAKMSREEKASGITPDNLTKTEILLEEIKEIITSSSSTCSMNSTTKEADRAKAMSVRKMAMESWGKRSAKEGNEDDDDDEDDQVVKRRKRTRRSAVDPMDYLKMRRESEIEMKKEEMALLKEKLALEDKRIELEKKRQAQIEEQLKMQQQRMLQSQNMILAMLQKMNKSAK